MPRLFTQLACGSGLYGFSRVDQAGRRFERDLARAQAILGHKDDLAVRGNRDDVDPVGRIEDKELAALAGRRRADDFAVKREYPAVLEFFSLLDDPRLDLVVIMRAHNVLLLRHLVLIRYQ